MLNVFLGSRKRRRVNCLCQTCLGQKGKFWTLIESDDSFLGGDKNRDLAVLNYFLISLDSNPVYTCYGCCVAQVTKISYFVHFGLNLPRNYIFQINRTP